MNHRSHVTPPRQFPLATVGVIFLSASVGLLAFAIHAGTKAARTLIEQLPPVTTITQTTNVWSMLEGCYPRNRLLVVEEQINEEFTEHWKAEPPWWRIPLGDWPGEAIVRLRAPARVLYSVPLDADWTFRANDGVVEVTLPSPSVEAVELQTKGVQTFYDKTAARFHEDQMEDKLRKGLLPGMRERALARTQTPQFQQTANVAIERFVREFVLTRIINTPIKSVSIIYRESPRPLS